MLHFKQGGSKAGEPDTPLGLRAASKLIISEAQKRNVGKVGLINVPRYAVKPAHPDSAPPTLNAETNPRRYRLHRHDGLAAATQIAQPGLAHASPHNHNADTSSCVHHAAQRSGCDLPRTSMSLHCTHHRLVFSGSGLALAAAALGPPTNPSRISKQATHCVSNCGQRRTRPITTTSDTVCDLAMRLAVLMQCPNLSDLKGARSVAMG